MFSWVNKQKLKPGPKVVWYTIWLIFGVALIIFGIIQESPLTIITFVLILAMALLIKQRPENKIKIAIFKECLKINSEKHYYRDLKSFYISNNNLLLKTRSALRADIKLPLPPENLSEIKVALKKKMKYQKPEFNFLDIIAQHLGF